jgi:hypothetical protein
MMRNVGEKLMVKLLWIWEQGWNTPIKEYDLWKFPAMDFQVDELIAVPISGIAADIKEYATVQEAVIANQSLDLIVCTEKGGNVLEEFKHPINALYMFSNSGGSSMDFIGAHTPLRIDTPNNQGLLWGHQAASIVLYDRWLKCL